MTAAFVSAAATYRPPQNAISNRNHYQCKIFTGAPVQHSWSNRSKICFNNRPQHKNVNAIRPCCTQSDQLKKVEGEDKKSANGLEGDAIRSKGESEVVGESENGTGADVFPISTSENGIGEESEADNSKQVITTGNGNGKAQEKSDVFRLTVVGAAATFVAAFLQHSWVAEHGKSTMWGIFVLGYAGIILEELLDFSKTSVALVMGVGVWLTFAISSGEGASAEINLELSHKLGEVSEILFFLVGAMTIVELIDAHSGFKIVTDAIKTNSRRVLLWLIGFITFFMSCTLDNLTSTIVMVSLLRKLVSDPKERWLFGSIVVVAANAGGAWTPIGDVTTTMLWIHGNITTTRTITDLFLPSLVSMIITLAAFTPSLKGEFERPKEAIGALAPRGRLVFLAGLASLISVPVFKAVTGLPPYLGMLSGLGILWIYCDFIHAGAEDRDYLRGEAALKRIDTSGILFFLGVLLTVAGLESAGILKEVALFLDHIVPTKELIAAAIGVTSAVVDNVPLVAATMGMYDVSSIPPDSPLWQLIAFCAGTGGSLLIIGSAAGVALMSLEKVPFGWFAKKMTLPTLAGFIGGILTYMAMNSTHMLQATTAASL